MREFLMKRRGFLPTWAWIGLAIVAVLVYSEMNNVRRKGRDLRAPEPTTSHHMATTGGHETSFPVTGAIPGPAVVLTADTATPGQITGSLNRPSPPNLMGSSGRAGAAASGITQRGALGRSGGVPDGRRRVANLVTAGRSSPEILATGMNDRVMRTYAN